MLPVHTGGQEEAMSRIVIKVCSGCGQVKKFDKFVVIDQELQTLIRKGAVDIETTICPECDKAIDEKFESMVTKWRCPKCGKIHGCAFKTASLDLEEFCIRCQNGLSCDIRRATNISEEELLCIDCNGVLAI